MQATYWSLENAATESCEGECDVQHRHTPRVVVHQPRYDEGQVHGYHGRLAAEGLGEHAGQQAAHWHADQVDTTWNTRDNSTRESGTCNRPAPPPERSYTSCSLVYVWSMYVLCEDLRYDETNVPLKLQMSL